MILKLPYALHKAIPHLNHIVFDVYWSDGQVKISDFVKFAEWGTNKTISGGGIRIGNSGMIKNWDIIKDPDFIINESCEITKGKGKYLAYLWITRRTENGC